MVRLIAVLFLILGSRASLLHASDASAIRLGHLRLEPGSSAVRDQKFISGLPLGAEQADKIMLGAKGSLLESRTQHRGWCEISEIRSDGRVVMKITSTPLSIVESFDFSGYEVRVESSRNSYDRADSLALVQVRFRITGASVSPGSRHKVEVYRIEDGKPTPFSTVEENVTELRRGRYVFEVKDAGAGGGQSSPLELNINQGAIARGYDVDLVLKLNQQSLTLDTRPDHAAVSYRESSRGGSWIPYEKGSELAPGFYDVRATFGELESSHVRVRVESHKPPVPVTLIVPWRLTVRLDASHPSPSSIGCELWEGEPDTGALIEGKQIGANGEVEFTSLQAVEDPWIVLTADQARPSKKKLDTILKPGSSEDVPLKPPQPWPKVWIERFKGTVPVSVEWYYDGKNWSTLEEDKPIVIDDLLNDQEEKVLYLRVEGFDIYTHRWQAALGKEESIPLQQVLIPSATPGPSDRTREVEVGGMRLSFRRFDIGGGRVLWMLRDPLSFADLIKIQDGLSSGRDPSSFQVARGSGQTRITARNANPSDNWDVLERTLVDVERYLRSRGRITRNESLRWPNELDVGTIWRSLYKLDRDKEASTKSLDSLLPSRTGLFVLQGRQANTLNWVDVSSRDRDRRPKVNDSENAQMTVTSNDVKQVCRRVQLDASNFRDSNVAYHFIIEDRGGR